ncbi:MAG: hypothetical protein C4521_04195 [Actinobacteria bacterium]|nr:MAG: hypothetical protein C4521_04195 [Actinomycetota bacterium]
MRKIVLSILIVPVAMLALATPALAAPAAIPDRLHVQIWPEQDGQGRTSMLLLESAEYPKSLKLPIQVKFALPKGARVQWAGEVFGGSDTSKDVAAKYKVNPKSDYDEVVFTLTKARIAQVESDWSGLAINGDKRTVRLDWIQRYPAKSVYFAFKTPAGAQAPAMNPPIAYTDKDGDGLVFYGSGPLKLAVGQKQTVTLSYSIGPASGAESSSSSNLPLVVLVVVLGGGAILLTLYTQARKTSKTSS